MLGIEGDLEGMSEVFLRIWERDGEGFEKLGGFFSEKRRKSRIQKKRENRGRYIKDIGCE